MDKAKAYSRRRVILFFIDIALSIVLLLAIQFSGLSAGLKGISEVFFGNYYLKLLLYLALLSLILYISELPLTLYSGFILERKFNLSNQTIKTWCAEEIKRSILSFAIFAFLVGSLYAIIRAFPSVWWAAAGCGYAAFFVVFSRIFPVVIIPLCYKYKRIEDEALRGSIINLVNAARVKITDVLEIDFSKNTKKVNAALVGWGAGRRIILADNLINGFSCEEVAVVVAHEIGHYKLRHIWRLIASGAISTFLGFYVLSLLAGGAVKFFMAGGVDDFYIFPSIAVIFIIVNTIALPLHNAYSRALEREADTFALRLTKSKDSFISVMEKLAEKNLSDKNPSRIREIILYDHPPISKRIAAAQAFQG